MRRCHLFLLLALLVASACSSSHADEHLLIIDLNRTTTIPLTLQRVSTTPTPAQIISANSFGAYVVNTDTLSTDIYVASWDSLTYIPLFIQRGVSQRVCGVMHNDSLTHVSFSDLETQTLSRIEDIRRRLALQTDTILAHSDLRSPKTRVLAADTLLSLRQSFRREALECLAVADTSIVAIPLLRLPIFDPSADFAIYKRVAENLIIRHLRNDLVAHFVADVRTLSDTLSKKEKQSLLPRK